MILYLASLEDSPFTSSNPSDNPDAVNDADTNDDPRRDDLDRIPDDVVPDGVVESQGEVDSSDMYEDDTDDDGRYRAMGIGIFVTIAAVVVGFIVAGSIANQTGAVAAPTSTTPLESGIPYPNIVLSHMRVIDTVYTTDSLYLDVNLAKQDVTVRFRNGTSRRFLISSGTPALREGMATPAGLYTVQNMVPMAISKQFNDARLHHWIGVQGGVGFHGLDGSGYYGYLGKRPSSHGCIRMSREEVGEMYKIVHPGAMILVHYGTAARAVAFCSPSDTAGAQLIDSASVYNKGLGRERLSALMTGRYWTDPSPRLVHLAGQKVRWGLAIGEAKMVPKQEIPQTHFAIGFEKYVPTISVDQALVRNDHNLALLGTIADSMRMQQSRQDSSTSVEVVYGE